MLTFWITKRWYGNASTRKRVNTESDPKKRKPPQNEFFWGVSCFFKNYRKSLKLIFRGISCFFYPFPRFLGRIPVYMGLIFLRDFLIFSIRFLILGPFPVFRKSFKFSVCWSVSSFLGPFPHFLGPFPIFRKSCKFSVCWSVSFFLVSVSGFQKKFQILSLLIGFLFFWVRFRFSKKV